MNSAPLNVPLSPPAWTVPKGLHWSGNRNWNSSAFLVCRKWIDGVGWLYIHFFPNKKKVITKSTKMSGIRLLFSTITPFTFLLSNDSLHVTVDLVVGHVRTQTLLVHKPGSPADPASGTSSNKNILRHKSIMLLQFFNRVPRSDQHCYHTNPITLKNVVTPAE